MKIINYNVDIVKILQFLGIVVLLFLLVRGCKTNNSSIDKLNSIVKKYDSVLAENKKSDIIIDSLQADNDSIDKKNDSLKVLLNTKKETLKVYRTKIVKLADSSLFASSDSLRKVYSDSLANSVKSRDSDFVYYQNLVDSIIFSSDTASVNSKKIILEQEKKIFALNKALQECVLGVQKEIPKLKDRNQLFIGGDVLGNKSEILSGYGISAALMNKHGMIYNVGVLNVKNTQYYSGGIKFRLSFRKK